MNISSLKQQIAKEAARVAEMKAALAAQEQQCAKLEKTAKDVQEFEAEYPELTVIDQAQYKSILTLQPSVISLEVVNAIRLFEANPDWFITRSQGEGKQVVKLAACSTTRAYDETAGVYVHAPERLVRGSYHLTSFQLDVIFELVKQRLNMRAKEAAKSAKGIAQSDAAAKAAKEAEDNSAKMDRSRLAIMRMKEGRMLIADDFQRIVEYFVFVILGCTLDPENNWVATGNLPKSSDTENPRKHLVSASALHEIVGVDYSWCVYVLSLMNRLPDDVCIVLTMPADQAQKVQWVRVTSYRQGLLDRKNLAEISAVARSYSLALRTTHPEMRSLMPVEVVRRLALETKLEQDKVVDVLAGIKFEDQFLQKNGGYPALAESTHTP